MAASGPCGSCNETVSYLFAAQYKTETDEALMCCECYDDGCRCWVLPDENGEVHKRCNLTIDKVQPKNSKECPLYWDECNITGNNTEVTYYDEDLLDELSS